MFFHKDCGGKILVRASEIMDIYLILNFNGVMRGKLVVEEKNTKKMWEVKKFCHLCNKEVENSEVVDYCTRCDKMISLDEAFITGGYLTCDECGYRFNRISILDVEI